VASLALRDLTKRYDRAARPALDALSLDVSHGDFVVLLGPSGCGKSTVLRLVAGLEEPTAGSIVIDRRDVTDLSPAERNVAMVFQNYALYPHLTVRENIAFPLVMRRRPKGEIATAVTTTAARLGVADLLDRRPGELSGGERQRVALGRALVRDPTVFLFDEPLSNLDARLRVEMRAELLALHRSLGATMLYVTHDQVEAMTMGRMIAVLEGGRLRQCGTPRAIYERPADLFVATFVGSPGMNVLPVDVIPVAGLGATAREVGVRPEAIELGPPGAGLADAVVELVEPLGGETLVHVRLGSHRLIARVAGLEAPSPGSAVSVRFRPERLTAFDGEGLALRT